MGVGCRIVHENIQLPKTFPNFTDQFFDLFHVTHMAGDRIGLSPVVYDLFQQT